MDVEPVEDVRATAVRELLRGLWGDALPAVDDPWLLLVADGLAADDEAGRREGLVVRADALHLVVLERLVRGDLAPGEALSLLPEGLQQRLERTGQSET